MRTLLSLLSLLLALTLPALSGPKLPKVVVVTTGGTIAETDSPGSGGAVPAVSGEALVQAVPGLGRVAEIEVVEFSNLDSSQMTPRHWAALSRKVDEVLARPEVQAVVVTHGTDTMAEAAFFLQTTVVSDKPVVFTGAMNDASSPHPDGPGNLLDAVTAAVSPEARDWGVVVVLNRYVNGARAVCKTQTTNVQTFCSGERGYLGYVLDGSVRRFNDAPPRARIPLAGELPKVVYLATYAGDDGSLIRHAVESGAAGLVIDGVGAGNVNSACWSALQEALRRGLPVVISSRVAHGSVEPIYGDEGGGKTMQQAGCLLAGDLGGPKARLLLMLALARDPAKVREVFEEASR